MFWALMIFYGPFANVCFAFGLNLIQSSRNYTWGYERKITYIWCCNRANAWCICFFVIREMKQQEGGKQAKSDISSVVDAKPYTKHKNNRKKRCMADEQLQIHFRKLILIRRRSQSVVGRTKNGLATNNILIF